MKNTTQKLLAVATFTLMGIFGVSNTAFATNPTVTTLSPSSITQTSATLNASWAANGADDISVWFKYGTNPTMPSSTTPQIYTTASGSHTASISVTPGTTYYFQAVGVGDGFGYGSVIQFTVPAITAPTVMTLTPTNVAETSATLKGYFNGNGSTTTTWFKYANNSGLVGSTTTAQVVQSGNSGNFTQNISGLQANTTYYYKAYAQNAGGTTTASTTVSFTTTTNGGGGGNGCDITSFSANDTSINEGDTATLSWTTTNCTSASITSIGSVTIPTGSVSTGTLYTTTTYTLSASGNGGSDSATVTITVTNNGGGGNNCTIDFFDAPNSVDEGDEATLEWETTNCDYVYLSGDGISGTYDEDDEVDTDEIWNDETYTITAYGNGGSVSESETIEADNGNNNNNDECEIDSFDVNDTSISYGDTVDLEWETTDCDDITIYGPVDGNNFDDDDETESDELYQTTTFTLYADGDEGSDSDTITVYVTGGNTDYYPPTYTPPFIPTYTPTYTTTPTNTNTVVNQTVYSGGGSSSNWLDLKVALRNEAVCPRDGYDATITYKNISGVELKNVVVRITVPHYVTLRSTTAGTYTQSDRSVTLTIASLPKNTSGTIYLTGNYSARSFSENRIVTTATASFVHSTKNLTDNAIAYGVQDPTECRSGNNLAGLALFGGDGFFPRTIVGWLILILLIAAALIIARELYGSKPSHSTH